MVKKKDGRRNASLSSLKGKTHSVHLLNPLDKQFYLIQINIDPCLSLLDQV